jgi:Holliday junction DNA helicase RuvB
MAMDDSTDSRGPLAAERVEGDAGLEQTLRPRSFDQFVGQEHVRRNLSVAVTAAKQREEALDHVLFSGLPGLGKTTLAYLLARELGTDIRETSGPALERPGDLVGILTNLRKADILFIDEIHRLSHVVEEYLYSAMEDFAIDVVIDQGPAARSVRIELQPFTLVGATTREGRLTAPFRARFGLLERLDPYPVEDLRTIVLQSARILRVEIEDEAAERIAAMARGTPRIANRFLKRIRDLAQVTANNEISDDVARRGLGMMRIDDHGLSDMDRRILETLLRADGQPVGLKTIAVSVGEEEETIEDVYEPYLIRQGLLLKTPRGRTATPRAAELLGHPAPGDAPSLFE